MTDRFHYNWLLNMGIAVIGYGLFLIFASIVKASPLLPTGLYVIGMTIACMIHLKNTRNREMARLTRNLGIPQPTLGRDHTLDS